jgi:hypothetical protein
MVTRRSFVPGSRRCMLRSETERGVDAEGADVFWISEPIHECTPEKHNIREELSTCGPGTVLHHHWLNGFNRGRRYKMGLTQPADANDLVSVNARTPDGEHAVALSGVRGLQH